jgi:hypothetical protein
MGPRRWQRLQEPTQETMPQPVQQTRLGRPTIGRSVKTGQTPVVRERAGGMANQCRRRRIPAWVSGVSQGLQTVQHELLIHRPLELDKGQASMRPPRIAPSTPPATPQATGAPQKMLNMTPASAPGTDNTPANNTMRVARDGLRKSKRRLISGFSETLCIRWRLSFHRSTAGLPGCFAPQGNPTDGRIK